MPSAYRHHERRHAKGLGIALALAARMLLIFASMRSAPSPAHSVASFTGRCIALCLGFVLAGCATTISTMQPAETLEPGHVQASGGMSVHVPASRVVSAVDVSGRLASRYGSDPNYRPSDDDQRKMLGAAVGLGLSSPGVNQDVMLRVGLFERFDAGLRWSGLAAHVDGKYMFLGDADSFQGSVSLGVSRALYSGFVFDVLDALKIGDYARTNIEVPLLFGKRLKTAGGETLGHVWFGPKYIASFYSLDASLKNVQAVAESHGLIHNAGVFGGAAIGYKYVFAFAELNVAYMFANPEILGKRTDLGGVVVVPAFGLMLRL